jgi:hypothetical protein
MPSSLRLLPWLLPWLLAMTPVRAAEPTESAFKAAFLYYFARYTEWPAPGSAFNLCLLGQESLGKALDPIGHKDIAGRPIIIRRVERPVRPADCNLLFIAASDHAYLPEIITALGNAPVLTVAEAGAYSPESVMLRMRLENGILVFDANTDLARKAGLTFSAKMLRLARTVHGAGSDRP